MFLYICKHGVLCDFFYNVWNLCVKLKAKKKRWGISHKKKHPHFLLHYIITLQIRWIHLAETKRSANIHIYEFGV